MPHELAENQKTGHNLIVIGTESNPLITELNGIYRKLGFYTHFENGKMIVLDPAGKVATEYESEVGVIQATQNTWNPKGTGVCENVVWVVSGTDEIGVRTAVETLALHYNKIRYAFGVIVKDGKVIKVPE